MGCGDGATEYHLVGWDYDRGHHQDFYFTGRLLAEQSSHAELHQRLIHEADGFAEKGDRCSACRWFEVRIYRRCEAGENGAEPKPSWVIETVGQTIVPGEEVRRQLRMTDKPRRVVSMLVQHKGNDTFLPAISKRVLDLAADEDEHLAEVVDDALDLS